MFAEIWAKAVDTYRSPRKGARMAIDEFDTFERIALIFGLSFCINAVMLVLRSIALGEDVSGDGGIVFFVVGNLFASAFAFAIMVLLAYAIGRFLFGGKGEPWEVAAALAWHSLVTAPFALVMNPFALMSEDVGGSAILSMILVGVTLWLLVNFIAEAHRFSSAWKVAGVIFGALFLLGALLPILLAGAISG
ncbi:MAG: YIP1 family protein [Pseudomonadota bacterium]